MNPRLKNSKILRRLPNNISSTIITEDFNMDSPVHDTTANELPNKTSGEAADTQDVKDQGGFFNFKTEIIWQKVIILAIMHVIAVYCALTFDYLRNWKTSLWMIGMWYLSGTGQTIGAHRHWAHRAFKSKWPVRVFHALFFYSCGVNNIYDWVRDHRVHHKYTDTDADPHNSNRGFFFSHMGWLMMKKHPEVIKKGREIDMSDILADPVVTFGDKYYHIIRIIMIFILPTLVPVYFWNETWSRAFISQGVIRYVATLHCALSVNSFAHLWGTKPFDATINPVQNLWVSIATAGEGWHNYHHVFPWDYKAAETPFLLVDFGTLQIRLLNLLGMTYDLKEPSLDLIKDTIVKRGDGTHSVWSEVPSPQKLKSW